MSNQNPNNGFQEAGSTILKTDGIRAIMFQRDGNTITIINL